MIDKLGDRPVLFRSVPCSDSDQTGSVMNDSVQLYLVYLVPAATCEKPYLSIRYSYMHSHAGARERAKLSSKTLQA